MNREFDLIDGEKVPYTYLQGNSIICGTLYTHVSKRAIDKIKNPIDDFFE